MTGAGSSTVSREARRMLEAWRRSDFGAFRQGWVKSLTESPQELSSLERERLELLEGVAEGMRSLTENLCRKQAVAPGRVDACLRLLAHLGEPAPRAAATWAARA